MTTAQTDYCPVCGRPNSWGCGHTSEQRRAARRHNITVGHLSGNCMHYDHSSCPDTCRFKALQVPPGFVPLLSHRAQAIDWESLKSMPTVAETVIDEEC